MTRPVSDAASNSHPVAAFIGCTNIPLASGEGSGGRDHSRRMIAVVPTPSAESRTIWARQTCFWAALRSAIRARRRRRTVDETVKEIPLRMVQTRMRQRAEESLSGFKCQILSTRTLWILLSTGYFRGVGGSRRIPAADFRLI